MKRGCICNSVANDGRTEVVMKFLQSIFVCSVLFTLGNCAELFQSSKKNNNNDAILALLAGARCPSSAVTLPTQGTRFDFANCTGDVNTALAGSGFQASNVTLSGGLVGTGNNSTIVTTGSNLSNSGGAKKATIEIVYQLNSASSTVSAILPATTSLDGPGFLIRNTTLDLIGSGTFNVKSVTPWSSSVGQDKTLCLEVHEEGGAHVFGWERACANVNRSVFDFDATGVTANLGGDRVALRINGATIKSITIYNQYIGQE